MLQVQQGGWLQRSFLPFCACVLALLREAFFPEVQAPPDAGLLTECTSLPSRPSCPLLPEGGSVAQRAIAAPGKRKSAAKADEAVSGDEDELWSNTFSGLEYEEGADGIRFAGLRGTGPPLC